MGEDGREGRPCYPGLMWGTPQKVNSFLISFDLLDGAHHRRHVGGRKWFPWSISWHYQMGVRATTTIMPREIATIKLEAFPSNGIRDLDSNHPSFSGAELPWTYCMPWTSASRWQFTLRSDHRVHPELNFTLTVVHTRTQAHTQHTWFSSVFKCQYKAAVCSNHPVSLSAFPGIFVLLSQQRFWSVSGTKLIKFQWVPYTPEGLCVGKAWCSAWPHSRFQSQTCPESAVWQVFWWGLEVKVNMLFFSEWSHSPQKQLNCLLLQGSLNEFHSSLDYICCHLNPSPKQLFLLLYTLHLDYCMPASHPWSLSPQPLWLPHNKYSRFITNWLLESRDEEIIVLKNHIKLVELS